MSTATEAQVHKELDLIQEVIKRQAANSFQVKTWTMSIVTAVLAFKNEEIFSSGKTSHHQGVWISLTLLLPITCFWLLDGFFLRTEKHYRAIYKWVVDNRKTTIDYLYDLNSFKRKDYTKTPPEDVDMEIDAGDLWDALYTKTLLLFYLVPFVVVLSLVIYNLINW